MFRKKVVSEEHLGLLFEDERFTRVLEPGVYLLKNPFKAQRVALYNTRVSAENPVPDDVLRLADRHGDVIESCLQRWQTADNEVGLVYVDGVLADVLSPAARGAYWRGERAIEVRLQAIEGEGLVEPVLAGLLRGARTRSLRDGASCACATITVPDGHSGFLQVDAKRVSVLPPGKHDYWKFDREVSVQLVDCRLQNMEVNGQEILTADKVALRVNLSATWQVVDAEKVLDQLSDHSDFLYRELQLALRTVVSTRTLDALLEDKNQLNQEVQNLVADRAAEFGLRVRSVGARDIVLPGEMKTILANVVEAQKRAEANLILRREETQATRSLHNTAKMMDGNQTLLRLKELEVLERVSAQVGTLNVYGGLDGVMNDLVKMTDSRASESA